MDSEVKIKQIVLNRMERCGVCHHTYVADDIHVISRKPDMWMMLVECTECHARNFVAAVLNDGDPAEAKLALRRLTRDIDPEPGDAPDEIGILSEADLVDGPPVTAHDVLDMHEFLNDFSGDFQALFKGA